MKLYILNGPNLNMLGVREPNQYGNETYEHLCERISAYCEQRKIEVVQKQTNHEGVLVDWIQEAYYEKADGLIINPGAYTHTSIALLDAVKATKLRTVEVHISNIAKREAFRQVSYIRQACEKSIIGHGTDGYIEAINYFLTMTRTNTFRNGGVSW